VSGNASDIGAEYGDAEVRELAAADIYGTAGVQQFWILVPLAVVIAAVGQGDRYP
jgi:hypothetical protein